MKQYLSIILLVVITGITLHAQEYFQQTVNYTLSVRLNDTDHTLKGFEKLVYINHSPDRLDFIYFHLWPNAYKNNTTAFAKQQLKNGSTEFYFADESERGYIDSLDFRVNGEQVKLIFENDIDICKMILNQPLLPGDSIVITTPFFVKIPGSFSRFGHAGQAYQITQWYPKPAVYDRTGWNQMPYLDQGEFYSEFGSFDVSITLPADYVVGATGNLITESERLWLDAKAADTAVVSGMVSDPGYKTIRYTERNVHDFAWFADKNYRVLKGQVELDNGHKVTTWAMFTPELAEKWKNASEYIGDAVTYYSKWYGNYPYNNCSAVSGSIEAGGAMEYPTITVVGNAGTVRMLEDFIMHEVGHNWFYGMLGFNERRYPMLDEGINTFSEFRYFRTKYPDLKLHEWLLDNPFISRMANINDLPISEYFNMTYMMSVRAGIDQPINLHSESYTSFNYGMIVYYKSSLVYTYLLQYLGEERFNEIMQKFFAAWQYKHPGPDDLRKAFEEGTKEDLSWIFNDLLTTRKRVNYAIGPVHENQVLVKNKDQVASPVQLSWSGSGQSKGSAWYPGFTGKKWLPLNTSEADRVVLFDSVYVPEYNRRNNYYRAQGLFKRMEPLDIKMIQIVEKPSRTLLGILPAVGWNNYNKTMLGILLYNPLLPSQRFDYQLMPMFGFGNTDLAGMGKVGLHFFPLSGFLQSVNVSVSGKRFGSVYKSYTWAKAEVLVTLNKNNNTGPIKTTFKLTGISVDQPGVFFQAPEYEFGKDYYLMLDANFDNDHVLHPFGMNLNFEKGNSYFKSSLTVNLAQTFAYAPKAIQLRLYAGALLQKDEFHGLRLSSASGIDDYRFENLYLGRYESPYDANRQKLLSQQFVMDEGGFVSYIPFGFTDNWLISAGLTIKVPKLKIVSIFANTGTFANADKVLWETGAMLKLGMIKVYFPAFVCNEIKEQNDLMTDRYIQKIRYSIDFNSINPFRFKNTMFN